MIIVYNVKEITKRKLYICEKYTKMEKENC